MRTAMLGITDYPAFVAAILVFLLLPGPGNLVIVASTGQAGVRGGMAATLGIVAGDQILLWCALAGVAALLASQPAAFRAGQWLGAAYLAWMGLRLWRAAPGNGTAFRIRPGHLFRQAFLITLLNPKAIVFYMAFFPLFVDPARQRGLLTFGAMALTIALLGLAYGFVASSLTQRLAERFRAHRRLVGGLNKLAAVFLIGFGVRLALTP